MTADHGWPMVRLGDVVEIPSTLINPTDIADDASYLGLEDLNKGGGIQRFQTAADSDIQSTKRVFSTQHILFGRLRPNLQKIAIPSRSGICTTDILTIETGDRIDQTFLYHYLLTPFVLSFTSEHTTGINLPRISPKQLLELPIPLPPLDEQRRIAGILDRAQKLISESTRQIELFDELVHSRFRTRFNFGRMDTSTVELGSIASFEGGKSLVAASPDGRSSFKVLKISSVTSGTFKPSEHKDLPSDYVPPPEHLVKPGDLLISRANTAALVGATAIVPEDIAPNLALPDKIWRFKWKNELSSRMFYQTLLQLPEMRSKISRLCGGTGGSMKNIPKSKLEKLRIPSPSFEDQAAFTNEVTQIDTLRKAAVETSLQLEELRSALLARAFQGEL